MKKIIASVVAVTIAFGGLALPAAESGLSFSAAISASADESTAADFNYTVLSDGTLKITKYKGKADNVVIPETIDGKKVTVIGRLAFYDYTRKNSLTIPSSLKTIEDDGFHYFSFDSVFIGSLKQWCELGNNPEGGTIFVNDVKLTGAVTIPNGTERIGDSAFNNRGEITSVSIPDSVTSIGYHAFAKCGNMTSVKMSNKVQTIGEGAFSDCEKLTAITLPDTVTDIGKDAFLNCYKLEKANIPSKVKVLKACTFESCGSLKNVTLSEGLTDIEKEAFYSCYSLSSIKFPSTLKTIGYHSFYRTSLTRAELPSGLTTIGQEAFYMCGSLQSVFVPKSVDSIGMWAFSAGSDDSKLFYEGSEASWIKIGGSKAFPDGCEFNVVYNYDPNHKHSYTTKITKQATCTAAGEKVLTCSICGDSYTQTIPAKGHSYGAGKITKQPTCTATGTREYTCSSCGSKKTETIKAKGHSYKTSVVAPTYEAQGYTLHKCSSCGNSYKDNYTAKKTVGKAAGNGFTCTATSVNFGWNKVANASGYKIYAYNTSTKKWKLVTTVSANTFTYKQSGSKSGTTYKYKVKAFVKENGKTYYGESSDTIVTTTKPAKVTIKSASVSKTAVKLKWGTVNGANGYRVYRYDSASKKWVTVSTVKDGKTVSYKDSKLKSGTSYKYKVKAYRKVGGNTYWGTASAVKTYKTK